MRPQEAQAPLKIERQFDGKTTIIWLIGRIRSEDLDELKAQMDDKSERMILDLHEVTLVHADVIRFLSTSEEEGITLVRCPPYVREWIQRERAEGETQSGEE
jgi:hypothetical protein